MIGLRVIAIAQDVTIKNSDNTTHSIPYNIIGETFTVRDVATDKYKSDKYYVIVGDNGFQYGWINAKCFKSVSEFREEKLNIILDES